MTASLESRLQRRMPHVLRLAIKFDGVGFRNVGLRFANQRDLLSTRGSYEWGGRFNVAKDFGVLYLSCDLHTCIEELNHAASYEGLDVEEKLPRMAVGIRVALKTVLDLTDPAIRRELGVTKKTLIQTDWAKENALGKEAPTQIIGWAAKSAGFEALLVPSARWPGRNLNLLDDGRLVTKASIINAHELDKRRRHRKKRP